MSINPVAGQSTYQSSAQVTDKKTEAEVAVKDTSAETAAVYERTESNPPKNVSKTYDASVAAQVKSAMASRQEALTKLVEQVVTMQGKKSNDYLTGLYNQFSKYNVDSMTPEQAQKEIGEDGFFGVKKTAERILDFAKSYAGDDIDKLEEMAAAIEKGFELAKRALGGTLPDISQKTYAAVQSGLDEWRNSIKAAKEED